MAQLLIIDRFAKTFNALSGGPVCRAADWYYHEECQGRRQSCSIHQLLDLRCIVFPTSGEAALITDSDVRGWESYELVYAAWNPNARCFDQGSDPEDFDGIHHGVDTCNVEKGREEFTYGEIYLVPSGTEDVESEGILVRNAN